MPRQQTWNYVCVDGNFHVEPKTWKTLIQFMYIYNCWHYHLQTVSRQSSNAHCFYHETRCSCLQTYAKWNVFAMAGTGWRLRLWMNRMLVHRNWNALFASWKPEKENISIKIFFGLIHALKTHSTFRFHRELSNSKDMENRKRRKKKWNDIS